MRSGGCGGLFCGRLGGSRRGRGGTGSIRLVGCYGRLVGGPLFGRRLRWRYIVDKEMRCQENFVGDAEGEDQGRVYLLMGKQRELARA